MVIYGLWWVGFPSWIITTREEEIQLSFYTKYLKLVLSLTLSLGSFGCWAVPGRCLVSCVPFSSAAGEGAQHLVGQGSRAAFCLQISVVKYAQLFVHMLPSPPRTAGWAVACSLGRLGGIGWKPWSGCGAHWDLGHWSGSFEIWHCLAWHGFVVQLAFQSSKTQY